MRQYEPIWNALKKNKSVQVRADFRAHKRIYKAVVKEKWLDLGFKIETDPYYAILSHSSKGNILTITMKLHRNLAHITEKNL